MITTIYKLYFDYEKEEKWLNEMSAKGLAFINYSAFTYQFEDCEPGEYIYRIELLEHVATHIESRKYIEFMEQNGIEHRASYARWVYFRQKAENGAFDLFSDIDSRIKHYQRIDILWFTLTCAEFLIAISQLSLAMSQNTIANYIIAGFLFLLSFLYFSLSHTIKKKIRALKKERKIRE